MTRRLWRRLRYRLGRRLLRPALIQQIIHYEDAADRAREHSDQPRAVHCDYIVLGLKYALLGTGGGRA